MKAQRDCKQEKDMGKFIKMLKLFLNCGAIIGVIAYLFIECYYKPKKEEEKKVESRNTEIRKIWRTLRNESELLSENEHPTDDLIKNLEIIGLSQKNKHEEDWKKNIKGLKPITSLKETDIINSYIEEYRFIAKKHHRETFGTANLSVTEDLIISELDNKFISSAPEEIYSIAYRKIEASEKTIPLVMQKGFHFVQDLDTDRLKDMPFIDLSSEKDQKQLRQLNISWPSDLKQRVDSEAGILIPSWAKFEEFTHCFPKRNKMIRVNIDDPKCKKYLKRLVVLFQSTIDENKEENCKIGPVKINNKNFDLCKSEDIHRIKKIGGIK